MNKLAAIYNVWDADYLLPYSIAQIINSVDVVIVVYQNESNFGEKYFPTIPNEVVKYHYTPNVSQSGRWNETRKRNIGLNIAKDLDCTHFISMDCDEFYDSEEFEQYKNRAIEFDASACMMYTYYKKPNIRLSPVEPYYVPFIHKIKPETTLGPHKYPVLVDPTRAVSTCKQFYQIDRPIMHHMSWCRKDIGQKLRNSTASINWKSKINEYIEEFNNFENNKKITFFRDYNYVFCADKFNLGHLF